MEYTVKSISRFRKDYKLMEKRNLDMSLLDEIIAKLAHLCAILSQSAKIK